MFKRFVAVLLLMALINCGFSRFMAYAGFELNQKFIARTLCVNKSRPWMHCDGKCYFMKKIQQAEETEKKQAERDGMSRLEISFFNEPFRVIFQQPFSLTAQPQSFTAYSYHYSSQYLATIFRPPKQVA